MHIVHIVKLLRYKKLTSKSRFHYFIVYFTIISFRAFVEDNKLKTFAIRVKDTYT